MLESRNYKLIFEEASELSLELCKVLINVDDKYPHYAQTTDDKEFFKNIFYSFLVSTENDYSGYAGTTPTQYSSEGFELDDKSGSNVIVDFNPATREWSYYDKWDASNESGTYKMNGVGFDNLVYNLDKQQNSISGWFRGAMWFSNDCFIGDQDKYPLVIVDLYEELDDDD